MGTSDFFRKKRKDRITPFHFLAISSFRRLLLTSSNAPSWLSPIDIRRRQCRSGKASGTITSQFALLIYLRIFANMRCRF